MYDRFDLYTCNRCQGVGRLSHYGHIDDGICYACGGVGFVVKNEHRVDNVLARMILVRKAIVVYPCLRKAGQRAIIRKMGDALKLMTPGLYEKMIQKIRAETDIRINEAWVEKNRPAQV